MDQFDNRPKHEIVAVGEKSPSQEEPGMTIIELPPANNEMVREIIQKRLDFAAELIRKDNPDVNCDITIQSDAVGFLNRLYDGCLSFILPMTSNIINYALEVEGMTFPLSIDAELAQRGFNDVKQSLTYDPEKGESPGKLRHFVAVD